MRPTPLEVITPVLRSIPIRPKEASKNVPATQIYVNGVCLVYRNERAPALYRVGG